MAKTVSVNKGASHRATDRPRPSRAKLKQICPLQAMAANSSGYIHWYRCHPTPRDRPCPICPSIETSTAHPATPLPPTGSAGAPPTREMLAKQSARKIPSCWLSHGCEPQQCGRWRSEASGPVQRFLRAGSLALAPRFRHHSGLRVKCEAPPRLADGKQVRTFSIPPRTFSVVRVSCILVDLRR
jgi:hypothetical protein